MQFTLSFSFRFFYRPKRDGAVRLNGLASWHEELARDSDELDMAHADEETKWLVDATERAAIILTPM